MCKSLCSRLDRKSCRCISSGRVVKSREAKHYRGWAIRDDHGSRRRHERLREACPFVLFSAVLTMLQFSCWCEAAKLLADTKAPLHARSSSAARALSGQTPANVGRLPHQSKAPSVPSSAGQQQQDDVQREESTSFKEVNGQTVQVVLGNYAYASPEGLPVSFKYMADENGNKASFTIGAAAAAAGGGSGSSGSKSRPAGAGSQRPGSTGAGKAGAGAGAGAKGNQFGKNAIGGDGDRKYLPPN